MHSHQTRLCREDFNAVERLTNVLVTDFARSTGKNSLAQKELTDGLESVDREAATIAAYEKRKDLTMGERRELLKRNFHIKNYLNEISGFAVRGAFYAETVAGIFSRAYQNIGQISYMPDMAFTDRPANQVWVTPSDYAIFGRAKAVADVFRQLQSQVSIEVHPNELGRGMMQAASTWNEIVKVTNSVLIYGPDKLSELESGIPREIPGQIEQIRKSIQENKAAMQQHIKLYGSSINFPDGPAAESAHRAVWEQPEASLKRCQDLMARIYAPYGGAAEFDVVDTSYRRKWDPSKQRSLEQTQAWVKHSPDAALLQVTLPVDREAFSALNEAASYLRGVKQSYFERFNEGDTMRRFDGALEKCRAFAQYMMDLKSPQIEDDEEEGLPSRHSGRGTVKGSSSRPMSSLPASNPAVVLAR